MSTKIALFADVQNIYYTTREIFARQFNYRALWARCLNDGTITHAFAYAIDRGDAGQQKFQSALRRIGFEVKLKPYIQRRDGSAKGDWDVGISIDVLEIAPLVDRIVLLSGDGDFDRLMAHVIAKHAIEAHVFGVRDLTARALIDSATLFTDIDKDLLL